jgi:hypothetical protein
LLALNCRRDNCVEQIALAFDKIKFLLVLRRISVTNNIKKKLQKLGQIENGIKKSSNNEI